MFYWWSCQPMFFWKTIYLCSISRYTVLLLFSSLVMQNFGSYKLIDFPPKADGPHLVLALKKERKSLSMNEYIFKKRIWSPEGLNFVKHLEITLVGLIPSPSLEMEEPGRRKRKIISQMWQPWSIEDENIIEHMHTLRPNAPPLSSFWHPRAASLDLTYRRMSCTRLQKYNSPPSVAFPVLPATTTLPCCWPVFCDFLFLCFVFLYCFVSVFLLFALFCCFFLLVA
jgi:hypothetical protein